MSRPPNGAEPAPSAPASERRVRLIVIGGFLGSGKTTTLLRLAAHYQSRGTRVGVIANDQGERLVDTERFRAAGLRAAEVTGGCFCCRFDDLIARTDELIEAHRPDVLLAEPVGSCTDLVATVLNPLARLYPGRFAVAPLAVLVDPLRVLDVLGGRRRVDLSEKVTYIFRLQQQEADCVAINKVDMLSPAQRVEVRALLQRQLPNATIVDFSALTGEGFDRLAAMLEGVRDGARRPPDVDYDVYAAGEAELGWLNRALDVQAAQPIDLDTAVLDLGRSLARTLHALRLPVAHTKLLVRSQGASGVVSLVGTGSAPELAHPAGRQASAFELVANLRVQGPAEVIERLVDDEVTAWALRNSLTIHTSFRQAFSPARPVPTHRMMEAPS